MTRVSSQRQDAEIRLLIVDDSDDDVMLLDLAMTRGGLAYSYTHVEELEELSEKLAHGEWDVVITDHNMPGFNSSDVLHLVKQDQKDLPVIIVSGEIRENDAITAMHHGAEDFVMKDRLSRLVPAIIREHKKYHSRKEKSQLEEDYRFLRYHDNLTSLVNRQEFESCVEKAMEDAGQRDVSHVLMILDLDQFKVVNDTCGHMAGDELLIKTTKTLKSCIRDHDVLSRLGGDEFGILVENCGKEDALTCARKIREAVKANRFIWQGDRHEVSISIGMVGISPVSRNHHELFSRADLACFAAKANNRNGIVWYSSDDKDLIQRQSEMQWAPRIKQAVEEDQFVLYQQPMANLQESSKGIHTEFLLRMIGEERLISPGEFIPAAERYNLMPLIDRWVITNVFDYLRVSGLSDSGDGTYFVNLSGSTLSDGTFFEFIKQAQEETGINPERVCFEITETAAIDNLVDAVEFIKEIRERGFKFALDDFGAGLSSFDYLKTIPVDYLKIDGSFVLNIVNNTIDKGIVDACNQIAHAAGLKTVAEFVENDAIQQVLTDMGIDYAQGYGIQKPGPLPKN